jgi:hypothetical protein
MPQPLIEVEQQKQWRNWHDTGGVGGTVEQFFTPRNRWADGSAIDPDKTFEPGLTALSAIISKAETEQKRLRAIGSGWSLSQIGFVSDYLVNTSRLTDWSIGLTARSVAPTCAAIANRIVFAQCGTQITSLNVGLEQRGLALPTSGASNGQTIAGAISTGTHGSAHAIGAMQDRVLALHIVAEKGAHYLIQPASRPAVTRAYCDWLGAALLENDELFAAALVSFGSFGIVHAVLLEATPLYLLGLYVKQFDYDDIVQAASTHDISNLKLADAGGTPYHIEFVINPYRRGQGEGGAFARIYYERPYLQGAPLPVLPLTGSETMFGRDLVSVVAVGSELAPAVMKDLLQSQIKSATPPTNGQVIVGTPGQCFNDSVRTGGGLSLEIGIALGDVSRTMEAIFSVTDAHAFGAPLSLRYVRASNALLAFTHFAPLTCTMEMPGIDAPNSVEAHRMIEVALARRGIPHSYHWGQQMPQDPAVMRAGFGDDRVDRWLNARRTFLSPAARKMFSNPLLDLLGLSA